MVELWQMHVENLKRLWIPGQMIHLLTSQRKIEERETGCHYFVQDVMLKVECKEELESHLRSAHMYNTKIFMHVLLEFSVI
jgi:hypothetical protein